MFTLVAYISTKKVTYASAMSSRMKPWEYMGRGTFSKWRKTKFSCRFCCSAEARCFFTHNFLITAAFISETCECSLTSIYTKRFFYICNLEIIWAGICRRGGIIANCLGKFLVGKSILRRHFRQCWLEYPLASNTAAFLGLCLCLCYTRFTYLF